MRNFVQLATKLDVDEIRRIKKSAYAKATADRSAFAVGARARGLV